MAAPAHTQTPIRILGDAGDNPAIMENLHPRIINVQRSKTPWFSMLPKKSISQPVGEWNDDAFNDLTLTAAPYGDNLTPTARVNVKRRKIVTQTMWTAASIATEEMRSDHAGFTDRMSFELMKMGVELRIVMAEELPKNQGAVIQSETNTANIAAGLPAFISTNIDQADDATAGGFSETTLLPVARTPGTARTLTEDMIRSVEGKMWKDSSGMSKELWMNLKQKQRFSQLTGIASLRNPQNGNMQADIIGAANVYRSDTDTLFVTHIDPYFPDDAIFFLDRSMIDICGLWFFMTVNLAKLGHSERFGLSSNYALRVQGEKSMGAIYDLN